MTADGGGIAVVITITIMVIVLILELYIHPLVVREEVVEAAVVAQVAADAQVAVDAPVAAVDVGAAVNAVDCMAIELHLVLLLSYKEHNLGLCRSALSSALSRRSKSITYCLVSKL